MGCSWSFKTSVEALRAAGVKGAEVGADTAKIINHWGLKNTSQLEISAVYPARQEKK